MTQIFFGVAQVLLGPARGSPSVRGSPLVLMAYCMNGCLTYHAYWLSTGIVTLLSSKLKHGNIIWCMVFNWSVISTSTSTCTTYILNHLLRLWWWWCISYTTATKWWSRVIMPQSFNLIIKQCQASLCSSTRWGNPWQTTIKFVLIKTGSHGCW